MKKTLLVLLVPIVLAACGSEATDSTEPSENPVDETEESTDAESTEGTEEDSESTEEADEESNGVDNSNIEEFEEYEIVADHIDLDTHTGVVETNNDGNRVILYEDENGQKDYKSVFVKHDSHLKIISLKDDEKPLYNDHIE